MDRDNHYALHVSTYPPRECGIATFTKDLVTALNKRFNPALKSRVIALNDEPTSIYNYDKKMLYQSIPATELEHYVATAKKLNKDDSVKVVNIQHEYGIFGGTWGDYLIPFLQVVEKPVVMTLHSVIPNPEPELKKRMQTIAGRIDSFVVMNKNSVETLKNHYRIPARKIQYIPHGIPHTPFESSSKAKEELGLQGKTILSTFGLLSANKGIEYAIRALPKIIQTYPNVLYLIIGVTHPVVRNEEGESYRNKLHREVKRLNLKDHVKFYNHYLTLEELVQHLRATDIYVYPIKDTAQSVSGSLSYALGCGRPVIATASRYAEQLVDPTNGILVPPKNHTTITHALRALLEDPKRRKAMSMAAYEATRHMTWPNVARAYYDLYKKIGAVGQEERKFPRIKFDHLIRLTDNFGMLHHAKFSNPEKRCGYSLDDNARALIATTEYYREEPSSQLEKLMETYLGFMEFTQRPSGTFANIVSYRKHRDATKDEDVQGRAVWALGTVATKEYLPTSIRERAHRMLRKSIPLITNLSSPRAVAFAMAGLHTYLQKRPDKALMARFEELAEHQLTHYRENAEKEWQWFEHHLTYSNSKLPESLYYAYNLTGKKRYLAVAEKTLDFLTQTTSDEKNQYVPIGENGWYFRDKKRAYYDQQPEDAASMVQTKLIAYKITKNKAHINDAVTAFEWFLGKNHLRQTVYDEVTGGCQDGVGEHAINLNQGAESTISYLLARLAFEDPEIKAVL